MGRIGRRTLNGLLGLLVAGLLAAPAAAQTPASPWVAWYGCWEPADQVATEEDEEAPLLCVRPVDGGGAEMVEVTAEGPVVVETIWPDGRERESEVEGCRGVESATVSDDGRRIYRSADLVCEGGNDWVSSGLLAWIAPDRWIDVQVTDVGGQQTAFVRHYRAASRARVEGTGFGGLVAGRERAVRAARMHAAATPRIEDVVEASANVPGEAVKAWLAEQGEALDVTGDELVRMADAGVEPEVIDVVVAVSHPERFELDLSGQVEEYARADGNYDEYGPRRVPAWGWGHGWGYRGYDPYFYRYNRYGYYGGYYGGGYYGGGGVIIVRPKEREGGIGRVIRGLGYSSGRDRDDSGGSVRSGGDGGSSGGAVRRGTGATRGSASSGSGGSSGDSKSGRKAKRRGSGGSGGSGGGLL